jgi:hypothetical protein
LLVKTGLVDPETLMADQVEILRLEVEDRFVADPDQAVAYQVVENLPWVG